MSNLCIPGGALLVISGKVVVFYAKGNFIAALLIEMVAKFYYNGLNIELKHPQRCVFLLSFGVEAKIALDWMESWRQ